MDVGQYLEIFIDETKEHLQSLNEHLLILEKEPDNDNTINEIFRAAHSLKGMAGTMGYKLMQRLTHDMENVFSEVRNGHLKVNSNMVDVLFRGLDALETYLANIIESSNEGDDDNEDILKDLNNFLQEGGASETKEEATKNNDRAPVSYDNDKYKFKNLKFEDHEKRAILRAGEMGLSVIGLTVYIQETCMLKGARAFMINRNLEEHGEIIKLDPSAQDIEDEKYDFVYSAFVITKEKPETLISVASSVSEVKEVVADYITISDEDKATLAASAKLVKDTQGKGTKDSGSLKASGATTAQKTTAKPVVNRSVRVDIDKLDVLMNLVSELIIAKNGLVSISSENEISTDSAYHEQLEYLERITTNLHESVMKTRMVPIESVVNRFPRMIRDISKKMNKDMELYMSGEDTELDRTVIDEIGDPLMHLLRNAADHGLEDNDVREKAGKNPKGSIFLDAYQEGNNVVIEVRDDGGGINVENVRQKAIDKGNITVEQADRMSEKDIIDLLFRPSFSTAEQVSEISGRGVGLDVVKTKIETLGGEIEAKTKLGEGTNFIIRLPLTLAIIQALMVIIGDEKYALPLGSIQTVENVKVSDIRQVEGKDVINLRGHVVPIIYLSQVLDCKTSDEKQDELLVAIVKKGERLGGMVVDALIGQQEIVIKSIGKYIKSSKLISGATILGNGEVALILDVNSLV